MVLKKVTDTWWILTSDDGLVKLTWFGATRGEVLARFNAYIKLEAPMRQLSRDTLNLRSAPAARQERTGAR